MLNRILIATLPLWLAAASVNAGTVTFSDQVFNDSDWTVNTQIIDSGGTVSATQNASGGNPDEFRRIVNTVFGVSGGPNSAIWGFHLTDQAIFDPSVSGAIQSLDYQEDSIMFQGFGQGQASGAALMQDGNLFYSSNRVLSNQANWTTQSLLSLTSLSFTSLFDPTARPDFSASGGAITFGFFRANSTPGASGYSIDAGIDNWSVTLHTASAVPVPAAVWLFATALVGLVGFGKRRKS